MDQPLVSIVVISYNQSQYINEMLDSLNSQTYSNWELIVADDASKDNSVAVFKNWLQKNGISATEIFHTQNTGLATVLNEATELCNGDYVKFIAADDYLHPDYLQKTVSCLEAKGEDYAMVFTDTFRVEQNNGLKSSIMDYAFLENISKLNFRNKLIQVNFIPALTVLMRTSSLKETGKYDSRFLVEDYFRWLTFEEKYLIAFIPEKLAYYRFHEENISKTKMKRITIEAKMLQLIFDYDGIVKNNINDFIEGIYIRKENISDDLYHLYSNYAYHRKTLRFCIRYNIPPVFFRIFKRLFAKN